MPDTLEKIDGSLVQHGPANQRIYLMKLASDAGDSFLGRLDDLAAERGYSKIFAKAPASKRSIFEARGYRLEAAVPNFYRGEEDAHFWGKYRTAERGKAADSEQFRAVIEAAEAKSDTGVGCPLTAGFSIREMLPDDAEAMAEVFRQVFDSYPFPIDDPAFLREVMAKNVVLFGTFDCDRLVALSSSEIDEAGSNVEMTDFATLPSHQGMGLATHLLAEMDEAMARRGIATGYTIARSISFGMNITFAKLGYRFAGTLINNTNICGGMESMNVWYKPL